jgi:hypothetical protein
MPSTKKSDAAVLLTCRVRLATFTEIGRDRSRPRVALGDEELEISQTDAPSRSAAEVDAKEFAFPQPPANGFGLDPKILGNLRDRQELVFSSFYAMHLLDR